MTVPIPRSILVATDLTPACDAAVATAGRLAARSGAALHALHVHDFSPHIPGALPTDDFLERLARAESALMAQLWRTLPSGLAPASATVEIYSVAEAVGDHAIDVDADLVVIGAPRRRPPLGGFWPGTPERVLRRARRPVLVVPRALGVPLRSVVVGVDGSEAARDAARTAAGWAAWLGPDDGTGPDLHLAHVAAGPAGARPGWLPPLEEEVRAAAAGVRVHGDVVSGADPAARIAEIGGAREAELVVCGARRRGVMARVLAGSVSAEVTRRAAVPVLLVPEAASAGTPARPAARAGSASGPATSRPIGVGG
jgi:nucleotide-binding universal stress UspA family protein